MKLPLAALSLLFAVSAFAETTKPVTLTAQEYEAIINALAQRDPIMAALMQKQAQAQQAAEQDVKRAEPKK